MGQNGLLLTLTFPALNGQTRRGTIKITGNQPFLVSTAEGNASFTIMAGLPPNNSQGLRKVPGVFDANANPDLVWRNWLTGQNALWLMNGTSLKTVVDLLALPGDSYESGGPR